MRILMNTNYPKIIHRLSVLSLCVISFSRQRDRQNINRLTEGRLTEGQTKYQNIG